MPSPSSARRAALALAAFLDSPRAKVPGVEARDVRRVVEAFLGVAFDELGKEPARFDGEDLRAALLEGLPGRLRPRDPLAERLPEILESYLEHLVESEVVLGIFELRRALAEHVPALVELVRSGANAARRTAVPSDPFVHRADKTGRNDPCPCGSGKKFKKCHGA